MTTLATQTDPLARRVKIWRRWEFITAGIALLVTLLTLSRPYWFDEAQTIYYVQQPFSRMLKLVANDFAPPLYHILLWFWIRIAGTGEIATALPSLALSGVSLWLTFVLARSLFHRSAAMTATALYAVSYFFMWYAQETRMYALQTALALLSTLNFHHLLTRRRPSDGWWYAVFTLLGVYTHYPFWFLVAAQGVALAWLRSRRLTTLPWRWWLAAVSVCVFFALPSLVILADRVLYWYIPGDTVLDLYPVTLPWAPLRNGLGTIFSSLMFWNHYGMFPRWVAAVQGALVVFALVPLVVRRYRSGSGWEFSFQWYGRSEAVVFLLTLVAVPLVILTGLQVSFLRYIGYITPLLCILIAYGLHLRPRERTASRLHHLIFGSAIIVNVYFFTVYARIFPPNQYIDHWPRVAEYIEQHETPQVELILFVFQDHEAIFRRYYKGRLPVAGFLPADLSWTGNHDIDRVRWISRPGITARNAGAVAAYVHGYQAVWLPGPDIRFMFDRDAATWQWFEGHCTRTDMVTFKLQSPLNLYRYQGCRADLSDIPQFADR